MNQRWANPQDFCGRLNNRIMGIDKTRRSLCKISMLIGSRSQSTGEALISQLGQQRPIVPKNYYGLMTLQNRSKKLFIKFADAYFFGLITLMASNPSKGVPSFNSPSIFKLSLAGRARSIASILSIRSCRGKTVTYCRCIGDWQVG